VAVQLPQSQVRVVDWSAIANASSSSLLTGINAAADALADEIRAAGIASLRVNMVGFSAGAKVEDRLAQDLGRVNCLIAIDPAVPIQTDARGHSIRAKFALAAHARYSIAFHAAMRAGPSLTATDTVELAGLGGTTMEQHLESLDLFTLMMRRSAGLEGTFHDSISDLFSLQNILSANLPAWRKNAFSHEFEAVLSCSNGAGQPGATTPIELKYRDRRGLIHNIP
jgi:hypothetical protein